MQALRRLQGAWRELDGDQRLAGLAAVALLATMFLPWYDHNVFDERRGRFVSENVTAFGKLSFIEGAVFLVAFGIFLLLFARGERRAFHLPGGDGTVILAAGVWAALLLLWRVFDRPDAVGSAERYGITWGFFFAFIAAAAIAATGWKIRAAGRPEPPLVRDDGDDADPGHRTTATEVVPRRRRPPAQPAVPPSEQLTLDDAATERTAVPGEAPTRRVAPGEPAPPAPAPEEQTQVAPPPREEPPREEPPREERPREERPLPPPLRPGVFDQDSGDEPLRPGEIPRRARD